MLDFFFFFEAVDLKCWSINVNKYLTTRVKGTTERLF